MAMMIENFIQAVDPKAFTGNGTKQNSRKINTHRTLLIKKKQMKKSMFELLP